MKCIEKLAAKTLNDHLSHHSLYAKCQSAYREKFSTETALLKVHTDIVSALDCKEYAILVLLDLNAAFDTKDHGILINRLKTRCGVSGVVLNWFQSYLAGRTQSILIDRFESSSSILASSVSQGSRLGPLLFSLYTALLEDILAKHGLSSMLFADHAQLYITSNCPSNVVRNI